MKEIWGALAAPAATFRRLAERPRSLVAVLVWTFASLLATQALLPRLDVESMLRSQYAKSSQHLSDADIDKAVEMGDRFKWVTGFFFAGVAPVGITAFSAAILWMALHAFGNETAFRPLFAMSAHALMPRAVQAVVSIPFFLSATNVDPREVATIVKSNLGVLTSPITHPVRAAFLQSFDVFVLWSLALFVIGLAAVAHVRVRKAAMAVIGLWAAGIAVRVGFAALGSAMR